MVMGELACCFNKFVESLKIKETGVAMTAMAP